MTSAGIPRQNAHLENRPARKSPEMWSFQSLALDKAPGLHTTVDR